MEVHEIVEEDAGNKSEDSEPVRTLPIFPVPPKQEAENGRQIRTILQPVVWRDFVV